MIKKKTAAALISILLLATAGCGQIKRINKIEGCTIAVAPAPHASIDSRITTLIAKGHKAVDSIKAPIIGHASMTLEVKSPESPLMNFAADALRAEAHRHTNEKIDIAITNKGGLRSEITKGTITFGDIYNVFPFENTLVTLTLNGRQLLELFGEIAREGGEPISGARILITDEGQASKCLSAEVGGKSLPSNPHELQKREFRIATSDYLAQGNDGLATLAEGYDRKEYKITLRDLMINHISSLEKAGTSVSAAIDHRIKIVSSDKKPNNTHRTPHL